VGNNSEKNGNKVDLASEVYTEYGSFIRAVIGTQIKNESQADDIFQDFFLALIHKPLPDNVKDVKSYLYRAIMNDVVDTVRRTETYQTRIKKYCNQSNYLINNDGPENALIKKEQLDKMFDVIKGRLPSSQSVAIALHYREHHSIKEVAQKMGVNHRSVSRYLSVGLKKIRHLFNGKMG
jgi:RNA polymerase sigma factor (sigma-70 family)